MSAVKCEAPEGIAPGGAGRQGTIGTPVRVGTGYRRSGVRNEEAESHVQ